MCQTVQCIALRLYKECIYWQNHNLEPTKSTATITSKGQITIPKAIRTLLDLHSGDKIHFLLDESGVARLVPVTQDISRLKGIVAKPKKAVSIKELNATIRSPGSRH